jgi:divalent metal cation (Fe/Co/Zn/Cd) transporter
MQVGSYLKLSVAVALATMALKFGAWWFTGSVGLLSDALESLVNLAGAAFALLTRRERQERRHPMATTRQSTFLAASKAC